MEGPDLLLTIGLVLAIGLVALPVSQLLRLPVMVVLVALGIVDVPIDSLGAELLFTLGVALILFHGGMGISLRVVRRTLVGLLLLAGPGVMITAGVVAAAVVVLFGAPWQVGLLAGSVLAATDPAILIPLFDRLGLRPKVAQTVIAESALNDPMAAIATVTVTGIVVAGGAIGSGLDLAGGPLLDLAQAIAIGVAFGLVGGAIIALLLSNRRLGVLRESAAATLLAIVAIGYVESEIAGGSPYLAAFIAGLVIGNKDLIRVDHDHTQEQALETYTTQTVDIIVLAIFVILGLNLDLAMLWDNLWAGLGVMAVFLLVARPLTVAFGLGLDRRAAWTVREAGFVAWCRETGVVPVALAGGLLADGVPGAELVATLVTFAVITTLLLQATTAGWVARRLGLLDARPQVPPGT